MILGMNPQLLQPQILQGSMTPPQRLPTHLIAPQMVSPPIMVYPPATGYNPPPGMYKPPLPA